TVKKELAVTDPDVQIEINKTNLPDYTMDNLSQIAFLNAVYTCPNGVIGMMADVPGVVETSTNLAIVKVNNGIAEIASLQRSSVDSLRDDVCNMIRAAFELAGAKVEHSGAYPGWKPNVNSPILKIAKEIYYNKFGKQPEVKVIHAGLECGLIGNVFPKMDMISFGPTIRHPHSPDEKVNIPSVLKFWEFLLGVLENIPS
ncbi:MAG TPA: M20/M25/M40 family metallo-hydrolase, partial [Bacteroidales bacterium]|nr:M20/M25/M40 family metallo-hydrolase [Bacteroidales bacterium]